MCLYFRCLATDEESVRDRTEEEQPQDNGTEDKEKNDVPLKDDSPKSDELGKSMRMKREDGKMRSLSGRVFDLQGKNLKINIPLTTPSRTFSAISYLVREDLMNQSSKKCGPEGSKLQINRTKLHHAEKMIRGAFIELYKGLGYLKTYRYNTQINIKDFKKVFKRSKKRIKKRIRATLVFDFDMGEDLTCSPQSK